MTTASRTHDGRRRPGLLAKLALFLASLVVAVVVGEVLLRLAWHNPYVDEPADRIVRLRMQHPNTDHWVDRSVYDTAVPHVRFRSDRRAYLMPSKVHADPDATIAFLGGSTTACASVQEELRFPALVGSLLTDDGIATNTLNAARAGGTVHDSLNVLLNHVIDDQPDIVVLMHATNDIRVISRPPPYHMRMAEVVTVNHMLKWLLQMASSHSYIIGQARHYNSTTGQHRDAQHVEVKNDPARRRIPTEPFESRLRSFVRIAKSFGVTPVLMTQPLSSSRNALTPEWADQGNQDYFNRLIRDVALSEGVMLIDLVQYLHEEVPGWNEPMGLFFDGMHVTDEGSRVYATHIAEKLGPLAREVAERRRDGAEP
jgi:lysophospholipase L1-like esterase